MSRTKLDEIVDEEIIPESEEITTTDRLYRGQVLRVAERAFRHGVERAQQLPHPSLIQPAPAAAPLCPLCPHPPHEGKVCRIMVVDMNLMVATSDSCACGDRRSRQRRKGDTCCSTSPCGRRTGKDRRIRRGPR
jgi:hypothetical protein